MMVGLPPPLPSHFASGHFAREALKIQEDSIFIGSRLCLVEPSLQKLKLLAFTHSLYHSLKNDPRCIGQDGHPVNAHSMQLAATDICRSLRFSFPDQPVDSIPTRLA